MRLGAWVLVGITVAIGGPACSGGYPLPPTACDEWCHATKGESCPEHYRPSDCVSACESRKAKHADCQPQMEAEIACFRSTPGAAEARCDFFLDSRTLPCGTEALNLALCLEPPPTFP